MDLFYTHGMGGSLQAQPEIEDVFGPLGYTITRIPVPYHDSVRKLVLKLATLTFGDLCLWIDEGANRLLDTACRVASQEYVVVGDSMGGFISVIAAAQRDARVSHCILLACSGDICHAAMRLRQLSFGMRLIAGRFTFRGKGGISRQAYQAIGGQSDFQQEFDRVNTFQPERLARLRRLLILGDRGDPVAPEAACEHFAYGVKDSVVRMVYNEGRHHPIGKDALQRYAVPFLQNHPLPSVS
jgi:alpha-beta hydrolase superfamily lysophospholipase